MARKKVKKGVDWSLLVVSLVLALLLELIFYSPDNSETITMPALIELNSLPANLMVVEPVSSHKGLPAQLEIRGPAPLVQQGKDLDVKIQLKIPNQRAGEHVIMVDLDEIRLPSGVEVVGINPPSVKVRTERVVRKEVPVKLSRSGKLQDGYHVSETTIAPKTVFLKGPESVMHKVSELPTENLDISGLSENVRRELAIKVENSLVSAEVSTVSVALKVDLVSETRELKQILITVVPPSGLAATVNPAVADLLVSGPKKLLENLDSKKLTVVADARELKRGKHEIVLGGEIVPGVKVIKTNPEKVVVRLLAGRM